MNKPTDQISDGLDVAVSKIQSWYSGFYELIPNLLAGFIIALLFLILAYAVKRSFASYFQRRGRIDLGQLLSDVFFWTVFILGCLIALTIITPSLKPVDLLSGLGIGSLAIGFAFKDILQNWLAGLLILLRMPFRRGDQVQIGDIEGMVVRIEPRATIIRTYDGRDIVVPNTNVYTSNVIIQTSQETRRVDIDITVGYDYDVAHIKEIISKAFEPIDEILKNPKPQILCWELGSTSLGLKIRWWIRSERSEEVISKARAIQAIKEAFQANDIDPTDPSLVYTVNTKAADIEQDDSKKPAVITPPPPLEFEKLENDPETYTPKKDDKGSTLLVDDESN